MPAKLPPERRQAARLRRRWLLPLLVVPVLVAAVHAALWFWATTRLEQEATLWAALRRAEGWEVRHGPPARGGWPTQARLGIPDVSLQRDGAGWQAGQVALGLSPAAWDRLALSAAGPMAIAVGGQVYPMAAEGLAADLPLGPPRVSGLPRDAVLRADRLRLDLPGGQLEASTLRVDLVGGDGAGPQDPLVTLRGHAATIVLPPRLAAAPGVKLLGQTLDRVAIDVAISGPWPGLAGAPAARAARWRDGGGTLDVRELGFGWGAARAGMTAVLALDGALQPAGEGILRLSGAGAVLDAAREAGLIGRREVTAAQMLLVLMQRTPPEGGPPRLEIPAMLERRTFSLGGMALGQLPAWQWPAATR